MLLLADFTLGDPLVSMIALFFLILAVWLFIAVFADIFTRPDLSGWGKARGGALLIFILPVIGGRILPDCTSAGGGGRGAGDTPEGLGGLPGLDAARSPHTDST